MNNPTTWETIATTTSTSESGTTRTVFFKRSPDGTMFATYRVRSDNPDSPYAFRKHSDLSAARTEFALLGEDLIVAAVSVASVTPRDDGEMIPDVTHTRDGLPIFPPEGPPVELI